MKSEGERPPAVIHVDLDGLASIWRIHGWQGAPEHDPLFESGMRALLELFDAQRVRATFYLIAEDLRVASRRELVEESVRRGHGIGSHSLTHRHFDGLSLDERRREIEESRDLIRAELGVEVEGFRAPNFEISRETLELVDAAGYAFDSSSFPTRRFARRLGLDALPLKPFRPLAGRALLELPLPSYAPLPWPWHPSYALMLGGWYFRLGQARFRKLGAPLILVFHLTDLADPVPDELLPGARARLFTLSHLSARRKRAGCERILARLRESHELIDSTELIARYR